MGGLRIVTAALLFATSAALPRPPGGDPPGITFDSPISFVGQDGGILLTRLTEPRSNFSLAIPVDGGVLVTATMSPFTSQIAAITRSPSGLHRLHCTPPSPQTPLELITYRNYTSGSFITLPWDALTFGEDGHIYGLTSGSKSQLFRMVVHHSNSGDSSLSWVSLDLLYEDLGSRNGKRSLTPYQSEKGVALSMMETWGDGGTLSQMVISVEGNIAIVESTSMDPLANVYGIEAADIFDNGTVLLLARRDSPTGRPQLMTVDTKRLTTTRSITFPDPTFLVDIRALFFFDKFISAMPVWGCSQGQKIGELRVPESKNGFTAFKLGPTDAEVSYSALDRNLDRPQLQIGRWRSAEAKSTIFQSVASTTTTKSQKDSGAPGVRGFLTLRTPFAEGKFMLERSYLVRVVGTSELAGGLGVSIGLTPVASSGSKFTVQFNDPEETGARAVISASGYTASPVILGTMQGTGTGTFNLPSLTESTSIDIRVAMFSPTAVEITGCKTCISTVRILERSSSQTDAILNSPPTIGSEVADFMEFLFLTEQRIRRGGGTGPPTSSAFFRNLQDRPAQMTPSQTIAYLSAFGVALNAWEKDAPPSEAIVRLQALMNQVAESASLPPVVPGLSRVQVLDEWTINTCQGVVAAVSSLVKQHGNYTGEAALPIIHTTEDLLRSFVRVVSLGPDTELKWGDMAVCKATLTGAARAVCDGPVFSREIEYGVEDRFIVALRRGKASNLDTDISPAYANFGESGWVGLFKLEGAPELDTSARPPLHFPLVASPEEKCWMRSRATLITANKAYIKSEGAPTSPTESGVVGVSCKANPTQTFIWVTAGKAQSPAIAPGLRPPPGGSTVLVLSGSSSESGQKFTESTPFLIAVISLGGLACICSLCSCGAAFGYWKSRKSQRYLGAPPGIDTTVNSDSFVGAGEDSMAHPEQSTIGRGGGEGYTHQEDAALPVPRGPSAAQMGQTDMHLNGNNSSFVAFEPPPRARSTSPPLVFYGGQQH